MGETGYVNLSIMYQGGGTNTVKSPDGEGLYLIEVNILTDHQTTTMPDVPTIVFNKIVDSSNTTVYEKLTEGVITFIKGFIRYTRLQ